MMSALYGLICESVQFRGFLVIDIAYHMAEVEVV